MAHIPSALLTYIESKSRTDKDIIAASTKNFDKAVAANKTSLEDAVKITGQSVDQFQRVAEWIAQPKAGGLAAGPCSPTKRA